MSSTFIPSDVIDMSKEKEWASKIGMLDWDSTNIVFTKRSLIEFLKYTGTTVDTNYNTISKLPRYAKFGKILDTPSSNDAIQSNEPQVSHTVSTDTPAVQPGRRVRTAPGGPTLDIFGPDEGDALATAPRKDSELSRETQVTLPQASADETVGSQVKESASVATNFKPTRRVRENPGGRSSLSNFWDVADSEPEFKPTRRVRERPGGEDHINNIFD
ncbi:hypothetical protein JOM56_003765 [Amanita muscaria]